MGCCSFQLYDFGIQSDNNDEDSSGPSLRIDPATTGRGGGVQGMQGLIFRVSKLGGC